MDETCRVLLARALPVLRSLLAPYSLRAVLLSGSASLGEAVGWEGSGEREAGTGNRTTGSGEGGTASGERYLLSDLDLGAVTDRRVDEDARRAVRAELAACGTRDLPLGGASPLTLGFYETRWCGAQSPSPGLVDLRARALVLLGEPSTRDLFRAPSPDAIPPFEALRLTGNRALELLREGGPAEGGPPGRARALHALAKAATGLWTARLVLQGRYRTGARERAAMLARMDGATSPGAGLSTTEDPVRAAAAAWTDFLLAPGPEKASPESLGLSLYRRGLAALLEEAARRMARMVSPRERLFLLEPLTPRERVRLLRRGFRTLDGLRGTPEGRRMAAAALYWRCLPEDPEPAWGGMSGPRSAEDRAHRDWETWSRSWLPGAAGTAAGAAGAAGARERTRRALFGEG